MFLRLSIAALWSPAGKGLTSWFLFVMLNCDFVTFQCSILGQVWYLIVSISDLCRLSYLSQKRLYHLRLVQALHVIMIFTTGYYGHHYSKGNTLALICYYRR